MEVNSVIEKEINIVVDSNIFSRDSILKCLYWYGDKFHVEIKFDNDNYFIILYPFNPDEWSNEDILSSHRKLQQDLLDFQLRDIVTKETKNIRDLLIAKAFSNGEFDELPPGFVSDPVGFDISKISNV
ncbi:His-Xaa-Ser system protein HxsD [Leptospira interrogans]|uniref:His-Xaa-Ser system protein HxsD n=1 Tax=Leptospira interrogans TaxID=173 RepID=UPI0002983EA0|nr:His-Xaa-Ser system protein HxsD [Leptospira interrogans]EKR15303.1 His-Xaa-Ser system protein HsxD [Leptospira interrogans serovar Pyrogenes str. 2006006960]KAA1264547.1 His-Xaa-Ser system protein HxsD [Leptospira interrogans serovar Weerasinghe]UML83177.1 His-Xaa-Ser system protein HxsD [Leptospira interrogans]